MQSVIALIHEAVRSDFDVSLTLLGNDSLVTRSRNTLVSMFMDMPQATHLLFVDADISFDPQQVTRMLQFGEPVVAGMYPLKVLDWQRAAPSNRSHREEDALHYCGQPCSGTAREDRDGFVTGDYAGTGFMLIARQVIETMIEAYAELGYSGAHTYTEGPQPNSRHYALFDCLIEPERRVYLSEDYAFCWRWRRLGGKVWLDTVGRLTHTGNHDFRGNPLPRYRQAS
jgi:hypothetical protein